MPGEKFKTWKKTDEDKYRKIGRAHHTVQSEDCKGIVADAWGEVMGVEAAKHFATTDLQTFGIIAAAPEV